MKINELRKRIKTKFVTISKFAELSGIDRYEIQKSFMKFYSTKPEYQELHKKIAEKLRELDPNDDDNVVPPDKIEALKEAVNASGGATKVCRDNPDTLTQSMVYGILSGKLNGGPVKKTPGVMKVFDHFRIQL